MIPTSFKTLHSFVINLDKEVTETATRTENGQEITVKTKVTKPVPHTVILKEPGRKERQDLAMFQTIMYNEAITKGLLPKVVMQQKVAKDASSPLSEDEDKNIAAMNVRLQELSNDYMRLSANHEPDTEELKARKERLLLEYSVLHKRVEDLNTAYQSVYAYTAESYMQTKTMSWLSLFLTYVQREGDVKPEPMFLGADFAAKEERAGDMEDTGDPLYKAALEKLPTYWMLFLFGRASKPEDFVRVEQEWARQVEAAAKMREEAEVAAKEAKGGTVVGVSKDDVPALIGTESVLPRKTVEKMGTDTLKGLNETPVTVNTPTTVPMVTGPEGSVTETPAATP